MQADGEMRSYKPLRKWEREKPQREEQRENKPSAILMKSKGKSPLFCPAVSYCQSAKVPQELRAAAHPAEHARAFLLL